MDWLETKYFHTAQYSMDCISLQNYVFITDLKICAD